MYRVLASPYYIAAQRRVWAANYSQSALPTCCHVDDVTFMVNEWQCFGRVVRFIIIIIIIVIIVLVF